NARAMGEFGAVYVVSGHIAGQTDTMPLRVEKLFQEYNNPGSFAVASLLTLLALVTLLVKVVLEHKTRRDLAEAAELKSVGGITLALPSVTVPRNSATFPRSVTSRSAFPADRCWPCWDLLALARPRCCELLPGWKALMPAAWSATAPT